MLRLLTAAALAGLCALAPAAHAHHQPRLPAQTAPAAVRHMAQPLVIGHRGASAYAPENTLTALDTAKGLGITWVENDVQRTRDGHLIVMHDTTLARTTNVEQLFPHRAPWRISDFTLHEIKQLDAGAHFSPQYAGQRVPTLAEYLNKLTANGQNLLLELKAPQLYPGIEAQTLGLLRQHGWLDAFHLQHQLVVQSFKVAAIQRVHALNPDVHTAVIGTPPIADLPAYARFTDHINPHYSTITSRYLRALHQLVGPHRQPLTAYAWIVNNPTTAARLASIGTDGFITGTPDAIRAATHQP